MEGNSLKQLRDFLMSRRDRLGEGVQVREREIDLLESGEARVEIVDIAQTLEQMGRNTALAEQERRELVAIEHALSKIAVGTFGFCEECEDEIPHKRLLAVPETKFCARCQSIAERAESRMRGAAGAVAR